MNRIFRCLSLAVLATFALSNVQAQFTQGNVVVLQVGDGSAALTNTATPVILKEYTTGTAAQSTPVSVTNIPTTGAARLTLGGTATSEGFITLSTDSLRLVIAGYDTGSTAVAPNTVTSALLARVADTLSSHGIPGRAVVTNSAYSGSNFRSVVRSNAENYWGSGNGTTNNGGTYYLGLTSAPAYVQTTVNNNRVNAIYNGNLYFSTGSGTLGVYKIAGLPTTATTPVSLIATGSGSQPYAFAVNSTETIVYVADDRTSNNAGGIQKWVYNAGSWGTTPADTLSVGTNIGARGLVVDWSGTYPAIYATTTDNRLVKVIDSSLAQNTYVTLATAPANTAFRSVAFSPRPLCVNPVLAATVTPRSCAGNGAISVSLTSGSVPTTYSWTGPNTFSASTQNISNLQAGTYTLTATTAFGCSMTLTSVVADNATLNAAVSPAGPASICAGGSLVLNANTGAGYTYQWNNAAGAIANATGAAFTATAAGTYTVTITSGVNCVATSAPVTVTITAPPAANVTPAGPLAICQGTSAVLHTNNASGLTYQWYKGGNPLTFETDSVYVANTAGSYTVAVSSGTGCTTTSSPVIITVNSLPAVSLTPSGSVNVCQGEAIQFNASTTSTGVSYQYYQGLTPGAAIAGATSAAYLYPSSAAANDTIFVKVTDANGCAGYGGSVLVTVRPKPTATISAASDTVCMNASVLLTATSAGAGAGYNVIRGNGSSIIASGNTLAVFSPLAGSTTFVTDSFRFVVMNASGCLDTSAWKKVVFRPLPAPAITYTGGALGTAQPYASYAWSINGVLIPGAGSATYTPTVNGNYNVLVSDAAGCSDTAQLAYTVTGLGVHNVAGISGVKVFPNPATSVLNIDASFAVNIVLRDAQGRVVLKADNARRLDISAIADGIYSLSATDTAGRALGTMRVVKVAP